MASSVNHTVRLPRRTNAASYCGQFVTRYLTFGILWRRKLRSYAAAKREIMPSVEHRQHEGLNNRAENFHQPIRQRERIMKRFNPACSQASPTRAEVVDVAIIVKLAPVGRHHSTQRSQS